MGSALPAISVVVLGAGNVLLSDEGIGVRVVEKLTRHYEFPPQVEVVDGGCSTMEMLDTFARASHLIIVDAVRSGRAPGAVVRLEGADVPVFFRTRLSPHQAGLCDMLATLEFMGEKPAYTLVVGVEPATMELGLELSPAVAPQLERVVDMVLDELTGLGIRPRPRQTPAPRGYFEPR